MTKEEIIKAIKDSKYDVIGIRHLADDEEYAVGDTCRNSYDWDWENDCSTYETTGEELDGTCAYNTGIELWWDEDEDIEEKFDKALKDSDDGYFGDDVVVIGGKDFEGGNDGHEVVIENATVIALI